MGLLRRIFQKKIEKLFAEKPVVYWPKRNYPLNLRENALARLDQAIFILAEKNLEIPAPFDGDWMVKAIGTFSILEEEHLRFYLEDIRKNEMVLQISGEGENIDITMLKSAYEIFPNNAAAVDEWANKEYGFLGNIDITTPQNGTRYYRVFQNPGPDHIDPFSFTENVYTENGVFMIRHEAMVFARQIELQEGLEPITETLIASKENDDEGSMIRIYIGVNLSPTALTII